LGELHEYRAAKRRQGRSSGGDAKLRPLVAAHGSSRKMTKAEFQAALRGVLDSHTPQAVQQVRLTLDAIPPKARELSVEVIPSQDPEGSFVSAVHDC
jgi:hypothetical protein